MSEPHDHQDDDQPALRFVHVDLDELRQARARHEMAQQERVQAVARFLDGLDVDQLLALRTILIQPQAEHANMFFDGQCVALLRARHGVDPDTGQSLEAALAEVVAEETGRG